MTMRYLFLIACFFCSSSIVCAGGRDSASIRLQPLRKTFVQGDEFLLTINVDGGIFIRSDFSKDTVSFYTDVTYYDTTAKQCFVKKWFSKNIKSKEISVANNNFTLTDSFVIPEAGLYQVTVKRLMPATIDTCFNIWTYSGSGGNTDAISSFLPVFNNDATQGQLIDTLSQSLKYLNTAAVQKRWDSTMNAMVGQKRNATGFLQKDISDTGYINYQAALVIGIQQPMNLLVLDDGLYGGKITADIITMMNTLLGKMLQLAYTDSAMSVLKDSTGKAAMVDSIFLGDTTLYGHDFIQSLFNVGDKRIIKDGGFLIEQFQSADVKDEDSLSTFRIVSCHKYFDQLIILFRFRSWHVDSTYKKSMATNDKPSPDNIPDSGPAKIGTKNPAVQAPAFSRPSSATFIASGSHLYNRIFKEGECDSVAFTTALEGYNYLSTLGILTNDRYLTVVDYTKRYNQKRLFVINMLADSLMISSTVAQGLHSAHFADHAPDQFSNDPTTNKSSLGFMLTGAAYANKSREGNDSEVCLHGLDSEYNSNVCTRGIIIHYGWSIHRERVYVTDSFAGNSDGCLAIPLEVTNKIIDLVKGGSCVFIYSDQIENYRAHSTVLTKKIKLPIIQEPVFDCGCNIDNSKQIFLPK